MASQLPEVIDEALLSCPLCLKTQQDPKILPCLHIFCKKCLKDYVEKSTNQITEKEVRGQPEGQSDTGSIKHEGEKDESGDELDITVMTSPVTSPVTSPMSQSHSASYKATSLPAALQPNSSAPCLLTASLTSQDASAEVPTSPSLLRPRASSQDDVLSLEESIELRQAALKKRRSRSMDFLSDATTSADSGFCSEGQRMSGGYVYPVSTPSPKTGSSDWPPVKSTNRSRHVDSIYQDIETMDFTEPPEQEKVASQRRVSLPAQEKPPPLLPKARRHNSEKPKVPPKPTITLKRWSVTKNSKRYKDRPRPPVLTPLKNTATTTTTTTTAPKQSENAQTHCPAKLKTEISVESTTKSVVSEKPTETKEKPARIPCPVCQFQYREKDLNVDKLKTCHFVSRLQDFVLTQTSRKKKCGNCDSASAKFHCFDCEQYLCSGCRDAHMWLKVTRDHKVVTFRDLHSGNFHHKSVSMMPCGLHPDTEATHFCATCDSLVCDDCRLVAHPHHACSEISAVSKRDKDYLQQLLDGLETKTQEFDQTATSQQAYEVECTAKKENLIENITAQKERLYIAIEECFTELVQQIDERYAEELNITSELKSSTQTIIDGISHTRKLTNQLLRHGKDPDVVSMRTILKERLQYLQEVTPSERVSTMEMDFYPTFPDLLTTMPMFGKVVQCNLPVYTPKQPSPAKQRALWEEKQRRSSNQPILLHSFKARTDRDSKGCKPTGIAVLSNNHIAIVDDINKKVKLLDPEGNLRREICPSGEHRLVDPWDIAVTKSKTLLITDKGAKCVKEFTTNGDFVKQFGSHLKCPWGVTCNSKGQIIVTDTVEKAVFIHNAEGHLLYSLPTSKKKGASYRLKCPEYVAVNQNDDIIVSDFEKHCLFIFDALGRLLFKVGKRGQGLSDFCVPCGVTVDADQNILVCDYNNQRVSMIDRNGQFKCNLLNLNNQIFMPQAVDVTREGYVVVADGAAVKIFKVKDKQEEEVNDPLSEEEVVLPENMEDNVPKYYNATYGTMLIDNPNNDKKVARETTV